MDVCLKLVIQEKNLRHKKILQVVWSSPSSLLSGIFLFYFILFLSFVCWGGGWGQNIWNFRSPPPPPSAPAHQHHMHSSLAPYTCSIHHQHHTHTAPHTHTPHSWHKLELKLSFWTWDPTKFHYQMLKSPKSSTQITTLSCL